MLRMGRGTAGHSPVVEGQCSPENAVSGCIDIAQHIDGRDMQDRDASSSENSIAPHIANWSIPAIMGLAIYFKCQLCTGAIEIQNIARHRMLTTKFHAPSATADTIP
ncbi:hypothetical protein BH10PSE13_BH10PSE13_08980 [soil metagenome]